MIKLIYLAYTWKELWSDDESAIEGYDSTGGGIFEQMFENEEKLNEYLEMRVVGAGESEGHETFKALLAYDKETGWYEVMSDRNVN